MGDKERCLQILNGGGFGLERESLRVDSEGRLAQTSHPFPGCPDIDRDFCENQVEIVTPVADSVDAVYDMIGNYHRKVVTGLKCLASGPEYLWPFSNPPYISGTDEIPIAQFTGELEERTRYRNYLCERYGKVKMTFSGIHFNYSYPEIFIESEMKRIGSGDKAEFTDHLYLELAKKLTEYSWLIVMLTSASPVNDRSFWELSEKRVCQDDTYASIRSSEDGYWNEFTPVLAYKNIRAYVDSINTYVESGSFISSKELYYPVRLKPRGDYSMEALKEKGVSHIEIRSIDLNPLAEYRIEKHDLKFIQKLIAWLTVAPESEFSENDQIAAISNMKKAAHIDLENIYISVNGEEKNILEQGRRILKEMLDMFPDDEDVLFQLDKINDPEKRYANIIKEKYSDDYTAKGLELAKR